MFAAFRARAPSAGSWACVWLACGGASAVGGFSWTSVHAEPGPAAGRAAVPLLAGKDLFPDAVASFEGNQDRRQRMEQMVLSVQDRICDAMSGADGEAFREELWERPRGGGGGRSRVLQGGNVFEKAAVLVSIVHGKIPPGGVAAMRANHSSASHPRLCSLLAFVRLGCLLCPRFYCSPLFDCARVLVCLCARVLAPFPGLNDYDGKTHLPFYACGISLVIHPHNPLTPTVHLNYRYFEVEVTAADGTQRIVAWFGGGADLTPSYLFEEDATHFHAVHKV